MTAEILHDLYIISMVVMTRNLSNISNIASSPPSEKKGGGEVEDFGSSDIGGGWP